MAPKKKSNKKQENLEEPFSNVVDDEAVPTVVVEEPKKESIDLEISEIFDPLLSNDLENLSLKTVYRPPSPPPRRVNRRGATMGMKLGF